MIHEEQILKDYDPALMRRLLRYLKPYLPVVALAVVFLVMATAAEMLLPVLIQSGVDNHILPYHRRLESQSLTEDQKQRLGKGKPLGEGAVYVPEARLSALGVAEKEELMRGGALSEQNYFLVEATGEAEAIVRGSPSLFERVAGGRYAVSEKDLRSLDRESVRALRLQHLRGLNRVVLLFFLTLVAVMGAGFMQIYLLTQIGQLVMKDIRTSLFDHTLNLSLRFIDSNPVGRLVTRITNDVETINELFTTVITSFLKDITLMIGVYVTLFLLNARLALFTLICVPPVFVAAYFYRRLARKAFRRVRAAVSALNAFLSEHISGMSVVQMFAREKAVHGEFAERNRRLFRADLAEMYVYATFRPMIDIIAFSAIGVIIYFGAASFVRNLVSIGVLIAFVNLIRKFFDPLRDMSEQYTVLQSAMAGSERVFQLMDEDSVIPQPEAPATDHRGRGSITFEDVCFHYKEGEPVLADLSFHVEAGETVAIVGYTGAGKTTIGSVLTRLWDIQSGRILLDGLDIRRLHTDTLRTRVQSALQDVFIFSGTVKENIRLGGDISDEEVQRAARIVRADTFIRKLPQGYETYLHERGSNLSTGQRQLVSFARLLAHDPDVLILDEATSNIDTETETLIQEAIDELIRDRTSLVIAHRLSTIRKANRILVLHHGRLVEEGTHSELMARRKMYYNLYKMQFEAHG